MADFDSFLLTDGVDYPQASHIMQLRANALRSEYINTQTLTATKELTDNDLPFQLLSTTGTANYTVELPPEATSNHVFLIYNGDSADTITVKDDSGVTTYIVLRPNQWAYFAQIQGIGWTIVSSGGVASWTPSWTNLTVGNATQAAYYTQRGNLIHATISLTWGNTTSASGSFFSSVPVNINTTALPANSVIGQAVYVDATGPSYTVGPVVVSSATAILLRVNNSAGTYVVPNTVNATVPQTWTTSDQIMISMTYFAA